jgi:gliding motility-associated-like protein
VTDVVNDDLADPNQGICGVEIDFVHQFSEDLEIFLTSPAGQTVQLMGPNTTDQFAFTFFTRWDVSFVQCAATAVPDSGYVARWNNGQARNFVSGGRYNGSYYPFDGCLEDFNMGPVNGTWTLTIQNNPSTYLGRIYDFRLRLCDERGFLCCFADAGSLANYNDISACEGNDDLLLEIPPEYSGIPPDSTEYGYTYLISQNDILLAYDTVPDLRGYAPGSYEVCGLSYRLIDRDSFPMPDGTTRVSDMRQQLNNNLLLYCGNITTNCVTVNVTTPPDTAFISEAICQGDTYTIGGQTFDMAGEYDVTLQSVGGCDSTVNLTLTVIDPIVNDIERTICAGDSVVVGSSVYTASGMYTDVLTSNAGCDSTVNLTLTVLDPVETDVSASICAGGSYTVGNDTFTAAGNFRIALQSAAGCDSIVNLALTISEPVAVVQPPDMLDCETTSVTLDGGSSTPAGNLTYGWSDIDGNTLGIGATVDVNQPGRYVLTVEQNAGGVNCSATDTVEVMENLTNAPVADAGAPPLITCANPEVTLDGSASTQAAGLNYSWSGPGIVRGETTLNPVVNQPGDYQLVVSNATGVCTDTAAVTIGIDTVRPVANAGNGFLLNCEVASVTLGNTNTSTGANITYEWQTSGGNFLSATDARTVEVNAPGSYTLVVTNNDNGCTATSLTVVSQDTSPPIAEAGEPSMITCNVPQAPLDGSASGQGSNIEYIWTNENGEVIGDSAIEFVSTPGTYFLEVRNTFNRCSATDSVEITQELGVPTITFGDRQIQCDSASLTLEAFVEPMGGNYTFDWQGPGIVGATDQPSVEVNQAGDYTLTVTNLDNGCTDSETITVTEQSCDICIDTTPPDALTCDNPTVTLQAAFCASCSDCTITWATTDGNLVSGDTTLTPTVDAPGTYVLTVTNSTGFAVSETFDVIEQTDLPMIDAGADQTITCDQPSVTVGGNSATGAAFTYIWTSASGGLVTPADTPTGMVDVADTYYLQITDTNTGCTALDSVVVSANVDQPTAEAGATAVLTCNAPTATLNGTASSTGANFIYNWNSPNGNIAAGADGLNPMVDAAGTYFLTVTDATNGCFAVDSVQVTADDLPDIPDIPDETLTCDVGSVTLTGTLPTTGNFQGRWCELDANNNPINCVDGLTLNVTTPGAYRFEVTDMATGCSASETVQVIDDFALPNVDAGAGDTLDCIQTEATLNASVIPMGNYTYQWTAQNGNPIQNETTLMPTVTQAGFYTLNVTNLDNGCVATDSVEVLENIAEPTIFAGLDTTLDCNTSFIQLNATVNGNNLLYQWTTSDGNIVSGADTPRPTVDQAGTYTLMATNTGNGCSAQDSIVVSQSADVPTIRISGAEDLDCNNNMATLDAGGSASATGAPLDFLWTVTNGEISGNPEQASIQTNTGGNFRLQITDTQNGCTATQSVTVNADFKEPEVSVAAPEAITCNRNEVTLDASSSVAGADFTVQWLDPAGNALPSTDLTITVAEAGTYQLLITQAGNGCTGTRSVTVVENTTPPMVTIDPPVTLDCQNTTTQLLARASGGNGTFTYNWTTQDGVIQEGQRTSTVTVAGSGTYLVEVTSQETGCVGQQSIVVDELESTIRQGFLTVATPDCAIPNSGLIAIDSVVGGAAPYVYSLNGGTFTTFSTFRELGPGDYDLVIQDRDGCEWETEVTVPEPETIFVSLGDDVSIDFGDSIELVPDIIPDTFAAVRWTPSDLVDTGSVNQVVAPPETTMFTVEVTGTNGCTVQDEIIVMVNQAINAFAPNVFSPNDDGVNDVFLVMTGDDVINIKTFMIFDRWGNRIYESGPFPPNDFNYGWDGRVDGEPMDVGVYVFFAELELDDGRTHLMEGDVTLVR